EVRPSKNAKQLNGAVPGTPDYVDLSVCSPVAEAGAVVQEVISALPASGQTALASAINERSFYVRAAAPTAAVKPDSQRFDGTHVTVGGLTLTTSAAWAPQAALTAALTPSTQGDGLVDLTLTSSPYQTLETL